MTRHGEPADLQILRFPAPWGGLVACTHKGLVRKGNEDRFGASPDGRTFAVADGMGGHDGGELAAEAAVAAATADASFPGTRANVVVSAAIERAQRAVAPLTVGKVGARAPGCTLVVAHLDPRARSVRIGWVGDSRAYLWDGTLVQITRDHAFAGQLTQAIGGSLEPTSGSAVTESLVLSQWLLVCTDGLHGFVDDAAIAEALRSHSRDTALRRLVGAAFARGAPDNITCVIARVG